MIHLRDPGPPLKGVGVPWDDHSPGQGRFEVAIDLRRDELGELVMQEEPDPRILVADEMLHTIIHRPLLVHPAITLAWESWEPCHAPPEVCCKDRGFMALRGNNCFYGALLTFDTTSGRIVYRIKEFVEPRAWRAQWPD
jgi:hypothetical protein